MQATLNAIVMPGLETKMDKAIVYVTPCTETMASSTTREATIGSCGTDDTEVRARDSFQDSNKQHLRTYQKLDVRKAFLTCPLKDLTM